MKILTNTRQHAVRDMEMGFLGHVSFRPGRSACLLLLSQRDICTSHSSEEDQSTKATDWKPAAAHQMAGSRSYDQEASHEKSHQTLHHAHHATSTTSNGVIPSLPIRPHVSRFRDIPGRIRRSIRPRRRSRLTQLSQPRRRLRHRPTILQKPSRQNLQLVQSSADRPDSIDIQEEHLGSLSATPPPINPLRHKRITPQHRPRNESFSSHRPIQAHSHATHPNIQTQ